MDGINVLIAWQSEASVSLRDIGGKLTLTTLFWFKSFYFKKILVWKILGPKILLGILGPKKIYIQKIFTSEQI